MKKFSFLFLCIFACMFTAAFIIFPDRYLAVCLAGLCLWAECVLPSLFPFAVLALLAAYSGALERAALPLKRVTAFFGLPPAAASLLVISLVSGYPTGAKTLEELCRHNAVSQADAKYLAYLCSTSGPMFLIGTVGVKGFGSSVVGISILICHILSVAVVALILSKLKAKTRTYVGAFARSKPENLVFAVFSGAVNSMLLAGGFIVFFYVLASFITDFSLLYPLEFLLTPIFKENAANICLGLIEPTSACLKVAFSPFAVPICGFLITFGGVSILMQQLAYLKNIGVSAKRFVLVKFLQAVICFFVLLIFFH